MPTNEPSPSAPDSGQASGPDASRDGRPESPLPASSRLYLPAASAWAAIHTKAKAEKVVAAFLAHEGVPQFVPLTYKRRVYGARIRESWIPLFPGYVFYDPTSIDRRRVFDTRKVANVLVPRDPEPLRRDLANLAHALAVEPSFRRHAFGPPGSPVRVVSGPLVGIEGRLVRTAGKSLLVILVDFVGFGAEVEIDEAHLAPAA
jgi:transcriptional antiterminator RfaH